MQSTNGFAFAEPTQYSERAYGNYPDKATSGCSKIAGVDTSNCSVKVSNGGKPLVGGASLTSCERGRSKPVSADRGLDSTSTSWGKGSADVGGCSGPSCGL